VGAGGKRVPLCIHCEIEFGPCNLAQQTTGQQFGRSPSGSYFLSLDVCTTPTFFVAEDI
jgi:hypothetical protein